MQFDFGDGMTIPLTLASDWLFIESAQGKLEVEIQDTGERVKLGRKSLYKSKEGVFGRLLITGAGQVELEHGTGDFIPPVEGQQLAIQSMPDVVVQSLPPVSIADQPAMEIAPNQEITVSQIPEITIAANQQIGVNALPDIQIAAGQQVGVATLPAVAIAEKQYIRIESMPVQKIAANQFIGIRRSEALATDEINVFPHDFPANPNRQKLILKAPSTNAAPVLIGAFSLDAGERLNIESVAALTITGAVGDKVQFMEW